MAVRVAIEMGGDREETDSDGRRPLHHACIRDQETLVELLLDFDAHVDVSDREGWTPLHFAARNHSVEVARKLLRARASIDAVDVHGNTPLFRAVFESRGRGEMIQLLLKSGADPRKQNSHGVSPEFLAGSIANYDVARWMKV